MKQLSERPELSWLAQPNVRFSRSGTSILVDAPREDQPRAKIELPVDTSGFTSITETTSGMMIRQRLEHAQPATAESAKGLLLFRGAFQGFDFFQRPSANQVEDFISLPTRPEQPRVSYEVELAQGVAGLRLVSGVLEFMDASGDPRLRVGPARILGADSQWHDVHIELEGCAADRSPTAPWGRPVTAPGSSKCRIVFTWDDAKELYPAVFDPSWTVTVGTMVSPRALAEAVLLNNNRILVAGGVSSFSPATILHSAELYDEQTGTWSPTGSMTYGRANFGMAFTASGSPRALAAGGEGTSAGSTFETYDPNTGMWGGARALPVIKDYPVVITRADGTIAIIGGQNDGGGCANRLTNVEIYDPTNNSVRSITPMSTGRVLHAATLLPDGRVLVTGGAGTCCPASCVGDLNSTEFLNADLTWSIGTPMQKSHSYHASILVGGGLRVLVVGDYGNAATTSDVYDIPSKHWSATRNTTLHIWNTHLTPSSDNRFMLAGGGDTDSRGDVSINSTFIYDPAADAWMAGSPLNVARRGHVQVSTALGRTLVAGGATGAGSTPTVLNTSELYDALPNGTACTGNGLCASQFCVDGVCCSSACTGSCDACNLPSAPGTCTVVPVSTPGNPACANHLVCSGASASCPTTCTSDSTCENGYYCLSGTCQPKKTDGQTCSGTNQCQSGFCVDGYCCNSACAGSCDACNLATPGTCTVVPVSTPGNPACSNHLVCSGTSANCPPVCTSDSTCENGYYCLSGTCQPKKPNGQTCSGINQCQSGFCVDGYCCNSACTGSCNACNLFTPQITPGTCANMPTGSPGNPVCPNHFVCSGGSSCPGLCTSDQNCESGYFCLNGACLPKNPNGHSCDGANQCQSGFCADGVCCNSNCNGSCDACNLSNSSGTCTPLPLGTPGVPACPNHFVCNGTGTNCPPACTSDLMCESGYFCLNGTCQPQNPDGHQCSGTNQCQSGFCVDGVCCNSACDNACDACNVGGSVGTCSNVPAGTSEAACGAYLCNGISPSCPTVCTTDQQCLAPALCINGKCQNPQPPGQPCTQPSQCQSGFCTDGVCCNSQCDGSCESCGVSGSLGTCKALAQGTPGEPVCAPYVCDGSGGACPTHCTADDQCAAGAYCEHGTCSTDARGHIGWSCGCDSAPEGSAFFALILLGLLALRRSEVRP